MKRVAILGATGSIGAQALDVAAAHPGLQVVALAADAQDEAARSTAARAHGVERIALLRPGAAARARDGLRGRRARRPAGAAVELVRAAGADVVLNAIVGAAGLEASLATLEAGADLALANKESLVAGGPLVLDGARAQRAAAAARRLRALGAPAVPRHRAARRRWQASS